MATVKRRRGRPPGSKVMKEVTPKAIEAEAVTSPPEPQPEPVASTPAYTEDRPVQHYRTEWADAKNPEMKIRWVRETPKHIQRRERQGYRMARPDEIASHSGWDNVDGAIHMGDRVAMICPKEYIDRRQSLHISEDKERSEQSGRQTSGRGFETYADHGQRKGSKFYSIP